VGGAQGKEKRDTRRGKDDKRTEGSTGDLIRAATAVLPKGTGWVQDNLQKDFLKLPTKEQFEGKNRSREGSLQPGGNMRAEKGM